MKNINEELLGFFSAKTEEHQPKSRIVEFLNQTTDWQKKKKAASLLLKEIATQLRKENIFVELMENNLKIYEEAVVKTLPEHRDHFVHSAYVYLLGLYIFGNNRKYRDSVLAALQTNLPSGDVQTDDNWFEEVFKFRWAVAAVFHDVGYPVQIAASQINTYLKSVINGDVFGEEAAMGFNMFHFNEVVSWEYLTTPDPNVQLVRNRDRELRQYIRADNVFDVIAFNLSAKFIDFSYQTIRRVIVERFQADMKGGRIDHGIMGSIILADWIHKLYASKGWNAEHFYCNIADCLGAIALHTCDKWLPESFKRKIQMDKHPIAYLLVLCDEIQEWFRPTGKDIESGNDFMSLIREFKITSGSNDFTINLGNKEDNSKLIGKLGGRLSPLFIREEIVAIEV